MVIVRLFDNQRIVLLVDEAGQDKACNYFITANIELNIDVDIARKLLGKAEQVSRKQKSKWSTAEQKIKWHYLEYALASLPYIKVYYSITPKPCNYTEIILKYIYLAVLKMRQDKNTHAAIYVEAMDRVTSYKFRKLAKQRYSFSNISFRPMRHKNDELARLADAFASMIRETLLGHRDSKVFFEKAKLARWLISL